MEAARERNRQIYKERLKGATFTELAEKYSISTTRIRTIFQLEEEKEKYKENEVYNALTTLCDDDQLIAKTLTILKRKDAMTPTELIKLDRKMLKKTRNCGEKMQDLIIEMQEFLEKDMIE